MKKKSYTQVLVYGVYHISLIGKAGTTVQMKSPTNCQLFDTCLQVVKVGITLHKCQFGHGHEGRINNMLHNFSKTD